MSYRSVSFAPLLLPDCFLLSKPLAHPTLSREKIHPGSTPSAIPESHGLSTPPTLGYRARAPRATSPSRSRRHTRPRRVLLPCLARYCEIPSPVLIPLLETIGAPLFLCTSNPIRQRRRPSRFPIPPYLGLHHFLHSMMVRPVDPILSPSGKTTAAGAIG